MNLPKCLRKFAHLIQEISDERSTDEGYWVYLVPGYWSPMHETHCIHEDTPAECADLMRYVEKCPCCNEKEEAKP